MSGRDGYFDPITPPAPPRPAGERQKAPPRVTLVQPASAGE